MNGETIISWSVANWITVFLMAVLGFAMLGLGVKLATSIRGGDNATT
jgi:hypothetical protein